MAERIDNQLDQSLATIDRLTKTASQIDRSALQSFEDIAKRYSLQRSQTVAGAIGASAGATAGISLSAALAPGFMALFGPAGMVIGVGVAILAWRGARHRKNERSLDTLGDNIKVLKEEIAQLKEAGAPDEVIASLWSHYKASFADHFERQLGKPSEEFFPRLILPATRPEASLLEAGSDKEVSSEDSRVTQASTGQ
jgi:hypothetical protein